MESTKNQAQESQKDSVSRETNPFTDLLTGFSGKPVPKPKPKPVFRVAKSKKRSRAQAEETLGSEAGQPIKIKREDSWEGACPAPSTLSPLAYGQLELAVKAVHLSDPTRPALGLLVDFIDEDTETRLLRELEAIPWVQRSTFGTPVPRLQAFYVTDPSKAKPYTFGGNTYHAKALSTAPSSLQEVTELYRKKTGIKANYLVLNLYKDGKGSILPHFDSDSLTKPIGCLSLGATRKFCLHPATGFKTMVSTVLPSRSLALMLPDAVSTPRHSVPKSKDKVGMRISITWREW
jgi:alkylated DNA repair dioxygenase AlkB